MFYIGSCFLNDYNSIRSVIGSYASDQFQKGRTSGQKDGSNVMIIGAGAAANAILKEIETSRYLNLNPKCIIDDNPGCHGKFLRECLFSEAETGSQMP